MPRISARRFVSAQETLLLALLIFAAATLYSSVGHAGASGYIAAMALFGMAPDVMKPTALVLNILVASITSFRFYKAGYFSWRTLWPFIVGSIPLSFVGGAFNLPGQWYKSLVGVILLFAAARLLWPNKTQNAAAVHEPPIGPAVAWGGMIGLLSGLTGTGGGIFLSPVLLFAGWAELRRTGGVSAVFILLNSLAGLAGRLTRVPTLAPATPWWALAACVGALLGAHLGSRKLPRAIFRRMLGVVLVVAGVKLLLT